MVTRQILLGVTGSVAAYKAAELVRLLTHANYEVNVVMSEAATHFISPRVFQALSANPVYTSPWDERPSNAMAHIELSRRADVFLIAPATSQCLFKIAHGVCDDLISMLAAARTCPLILAPAMNRQMWENPPNQRHIRQLIHDNVTLWGPASGIQACGENGLGRMVEPEEMVERLSGFFAPKPLAGKKVLMTAGPTFEPIDAVRGITNLSSGKMGYALARACRDAGASVILVSGPTGLPCPIDTTRIDVLTAHEMHTAVFNAVDTVDIFIAVAAVADYRVTNPSEHKLKRTDPIPTIGLAPNPDILAAVSHLPKPPFCVGFAAESQHLIEFAESKRIRKRLPMLVANLISDALGTDTNHVTILDKAGTHPLAHLSKDDTARAIVHHMAALLSERTP